MKSLDNLKSFTTFMDLIENPDKVQSMIAEAREATAAYHKAAGVAKEMADVRVYQTRLEEEHDLKMGELERQLQGVKRQESSLEKREAEMLAREEENSKKYREKDKEILARVKAVEVLEDQKKKLDAVIADYEEKATELFRLKEQFKKKEAALKAALL